MGVWLTLPFFLGAANPSKGAAARISSKSAPASAPAFQHGQGTFASTPEGRVYYELEGVGPKGPVLVIASGPGLQHTALHPWFSRLARSFALVYIDFLGTGRSDRAESPKSYSVEHEVEEIEAVRQAQKWPAFDIIALDYGGIPALSYVASHPSRVRRLVLSNALFSEESYTALQENEKHYVAETFPEVWRELSSPRDEGFLSSTREVQKLWMRGLTGASFYDEAHRPTITAPAETQDDDNTELSQALVGRDPRATITGTLKGLHLSTSLAHTVTPMLVVAGRADRLMTPRLLQSIGSNLPSGAVKEAVVFEKSGHYPWAEEPDAYFKVVTDFLSTGL